MHVRSFFAPLCCACFFVLNAPVATAQVTWRLDSLMTTWPVLAHKASEKDISRTGVVQMPVTDSAYAIIARHAGGFPVFADTMVEHYIQLFPGQRREELRVLLSMSKAYFPYLEQELLARHMPEALMYLPMAISAMNIQCGSDQGEAGLWMVSFPDALRGGLLVNADVDERHDPRKSTRVALDRYQELLERYTAQGPAALALVCGPANVTRARQRSGASTDLRLLYPHVDDAHRNLMPLWMACIFLSAQEEDMELETHAIQVDFPKDTARHDAPLVLDRVAAAMSLPLAQLEFLNPTLTRGVVPEGQVLLLPAGSGKEFAAKLDAMKAAPVVAVALEPVPEAKHPGTTTRHKVRSGESLGVIAENYGVSVSSLRNWNDLRGDRIYAGQVLIVHGKPIVPAATTPAPVANIPEPAKEENDPDNNDSSEYSWYTVRSGDSLYLIAKRYPGVSADELMRFNNIGADIRPGQRIKIPTAP